jgi:hypothetical protein
MLRTLIWSLIVATVSKTRPSRVQVCPILSYCAGLRNYDASRDRYDRYCGHTTIYRLLHASIMAVTDLTVVV